MIISDAEGLSVLQQLFDVSFKKIFFYLESKKILCNSAGESLCKSTKFCILFIVHWYHMKLSSLLVTIECRNL